MDDPYGGAAAGQAAAPPASRTADHRPRPRRQPRRAALQGRREPCGARDAGSRLAAFRGGAGRYRRGDGPGDRLDPRKARRVPRADHAGRRAGGEAAAEEFEPARPGRLGRPALRGAAREQHSGLLRLHAAWYERGRTRSFGMVNWRQISRRRWAAYLVLAFALADAAAIYYAHQSPEHALDRAGRRSTGGEALFAAAEAPSVIIKDVWPAAPAIAVQVMPARAPCSAGGSPRRRCPPIARSAGGEKRPDPVADIRGWRRASRSDSGLRVARLQQSRQGRAALRNGLRHRHGGTAGHGSERPASSARRPAGADRRDGANRRGERLCRYLCAACQGQRQRWRGDGRWSGAGQRRHPPFRKPILRPRRSFQRSPRIPRTKFRPADHRPGAGRLSSSRHCALTQRGGILCRRAQAMPPRPAARRGFSKGQFHDYRG